MNILPVLLALILFTLPVDAATLRHRPAQEAPLVQAPIPFLHGKYKHLDVEQDGRALVFISDEGWHNYGRGWINQDGSITIWWEMCGNGPEIGVYHLDCSEKHLRLVGKSAATGKATAINGVFVATEWCHNSIALEP